MTLESILRPVEGSSRLFELVLPYPATWTNSKGFKNTIVIPAGFRYDVASIPRIFWPLIAPRELGYKAPLVHDYLLSKQGYVSIETDGIRTRAHFFRPSIDKIFAVLMREAGVPRWKRRLAYRAVRLWSWFKGSKD